MARTKLLFSALLALPVIASIAACGGSVDSNPSDPTSPPQTQPLQCGGDSARLTPTGNTYDDQVGASSVTPIRVDMRVYGDASTSSSVEHLAPGAGADCPSDGLVARGTEPVEIAPGDYWICVDAGACSCVRARLEGGPASFVWEAGPGGGRLYVSGCAVALR